MNIKQILISLVIAMLSTGAYAAGGTGMGMGAGGEKQYQNIDANSDGNISKEELQAHKDRVDQMIENWQQADANQDGNVDTTEFSAFEQQYQQTPGGAGGGTEGGGESAE